MSDQEIETIYELAPMQQGMLFHSASAPQSGVYVQQLSCLLRGDLDVEAFARAWQQVVARHAILRTAFFWENLEKPLQVVYRSVEVPLDRQDWRDLPPQEQAVRLEAYLSGDRERGFDLTSAPLLRLLLARVAADTYRLVWSHHHILLDGWSLPLLLQEVLRCYESFRRDRPIQLDPPRSYQGYIEWLQQQDPARAEQFWRQALRGFSAPTPLGLDCRAASSDRAGGVEKLTLATATTAGLQALARQQAITLNTIVQGAWALLLSCYSRERDLVFGVTVAGRPPELAGVESMIGLFINTLPVRVQVDPDARLIPWLQQLQADQVKQRRYEYSPLVDVQGWSDVPRGTSLFESIVVFENYPIDGSLRNLDGDLTIEAVQIAEQTNYPLTIAAQPGSELRIELGYAASRFDDATIRRMLEHFATLLTGIAADPNRCLRELPVMPETERRQVVGTWNDTTVSFPEVGSLHQLVEAQVARTPDAIAVIFEQASLTYRELDERANQLARYLQRLGVQPESLVGLYLNRSLELIVGLLGVLKAGAAYLPLDPSYPQERLQWMLHDSQVSVVLTQAQLQGDLPSSPAAIVALDADWSRIAGQPVSSPLLTVEPEHPAYVIYTSGSTGQPKGVVIPHRAIVNHMQWMAEAFPLTHDDRVLQKSSISFDASVWEVYAPLISGAQLVLARPGGHQDPAYLIQTLQQERITVLQVVPTLLRVLLDEPSFGACATLRWLCCGGEALPRSWAEQAAALLPAAQIFNLYGPTEATIEATFTAWSPEQSGGIVPIGRPIANTRIYLVDAQMQPVPIGVVGELLIGGAGLARGYLNRPALTAERFVPDPFVHPEGSRPGTRLYRTGDLARYLPNGAIEFVGRIDHQVKLRGFRIELGEIEAMLRQHEAVREAIVVLREDRRGDPRLVAYLVENKEQTNKEQGNTNDLTNSCSLFPALCSADVRRYVGARLPAYMLPSAFVWLDALPVTASGKLDLRALPAPEQASGADVLSVGDAGPRTQVVELLATIWATVLGRERVGLYENFFDLGGHSLLATRVISQVRSSFQVELPMLSLFESPTVAGLARQIEAAIQADQSLTIPPIRPTGADHAPLSFTQQRLWTIDQHDRGNPAFNIPIAVRLTGALDLDALEQSLNAIVRRQSALRTIFVQEHGQPAQMIMPAVTIPLPVIDLGALPQPARAAEVRRLATEDAQRRFDLFHGPLLRCSVARLADVEHVLLLTIHHLIADGWSVGVLVRELATLYAAAVEQRSRQDDREDLLAELSPLSVQYADYAIWQRQWLQDETIDRLLGYWREQLRDAPPILALPTDYPRPESRTFSGDHRSLRLSDDLSQQLRALSRDESCTLFMTLLAGFNVLLWGVTGQSDIVVGSPSAGRVLAETENLVGLFLNTLPLRTRLVPDLTFQELLSEVRATTLAAYTHQYLPLAVLLDSLDLPRDPRYAPLFQVVFNMLNVPDVQIELPGLTVEAVPPGNPGSKFDFTIYIQESGGAIRFDLVYNSDLFTAARMESLLAQFNALLQAIVADPAQELAWLRQA